LAKCLEAGRLALTSFLVVICTLSTLNSSVKALESTKFYVYDVPYIRQSQSYWCGPASLTMILNYWGVEVTQDEVAAEVYDAQAHLTYMTEMAAYPKTLGFETEQRTGSISELKHWISLGRPLIVLQKFSLSNAYGHYRVVIGYDDEQRVVVTNDPSIEENYTIDYVQFATLWEPGTTFSTINWTLIITPKNDVLADLMQNTQRSLNQLPSLDYEKAVNELNFLKSTLIAFMASTIIVTTYASVITVVCLRQKRMIKKADSERKLTGQG